jgi:hypothetical protein
LHGIFDACVWVIVLFFHHSSPEIPGRSLEKNEEVFRRPTSAKAMPRLTADVADGLGENPENVGATRVEFLEAGINAPGYNELAAVSRAFKVAARISTAFSGCAAVYLSWKVALPTT